MFAWPVHTEKERKRYESDAKEAEKVKQFIIIIKKIIYSFVFYPLKSV